MSISRAVMLSSVAILFGGCGGSKQQQSLKCVNDSQCSVDGVIGKCVQSVSACAVPSSTCTSGYVYDKSAGSLAGQCVPAPAANGSTCSSDGDCASGICTAGLCCDARCDNLCTSCALAGHEGTCSPVPAGMPDAQGRCTNDNTACGHDGTCDGSGACRYISPSTVCKPSSCTAGIVTPASKCDGAGNCITAATHPCDPYVCMPDGSDCYQTCTSGGSQCKAPNVCTNNSCGPKPNGAACTGPSDCQSNYCVDGLCCNGACTASCMACNVPSKEGACSPVPAGNLDPKGTCTDQGASSCGHDGKCNGAGSCENYAAGTVCAPAQCDAATGGYRQQSTCPGNGAACNLATLYLCGSAGQYNCFMNNGTPTCFSACGGCLSGGPYPADCAPGHTCRTATCMNGDNIDTCQ